uniref:Uncharacterized protein n=1 Tax=Myoviridae sp. ctxym25 TaxID=2825210 RepID=A0A8S5QH00_9CAUD|nr:MAG TPA: hypothetical protein [Myoviridae sp. ctxym25]
MLLGTLLIIQEQPLLAWLSLVVFSFHSHVLPMEKLQ